LKNNTVTLWLVFRELINIIIRTSGVFIIVNYISIKDFGIYSAALGLQQFFALSLQMGINVFIVKYNEKNLKETCDSLFTLSLLISMTISLILLIFAFYTSNFILFLLFLTIPLNIIAIVPQGILEKEFKFSELAKIGIISQLMFYVVAIPLAMNDLKVWAPSIGFATMIMSSTFLTFYFSKYLPNFKMCYKINKQFLTFGLSYSISIVSFSLKNLIQPLIVAPLCGVELVGTISLTNRLIESLNIFSEAIKKYTISTLSLAQYNLEKFKLIISKSTTFQVISNGLTLLIFNTVVIILSSFIAIDDKWHPVLKLLPFVSIFSIIVSLSSIQIIAMQMINKNHVVSIYYLILNCFISLVSLYLLPKFHLIGYGLTLFFSIPASLYLIFNVNKKIGLVKYYNSFIWFLFFAISLLLVSFVHYSLFLLAFIPLFIHEERRFLIDFVEKFILKWKK